MLLRAWARCALACLPLLLPACGTLLSPYDARAYEVMTSLKARHLKLLEDATRGSERFAPTKLIQQCDDGDLRFREALEYASGRGDATRTRAFLFLHEVFTENCSALLKTLSDDSPANDGFSPAFVAEIRTEVGKNFDLAIAGEDARRSP